MKSALFAFLVVAATHSSAQVTGFVPADGYWARDLQLQGSTFAISASGKLALATDAPGGGAAIRIFDRVQPEGRVLLQTISANTWKYISGVAWDGNDQIVFSENGDLDTVLRWDGSVSSLLAPIGAVPDPADVVVLGSQVLALSASGPSLNSIYRLSWNTSGRVSPFFGNGYGGGLESDGTSVWVGDTNDPNFNGHPGQIYPGSLSFTGPLVTGVSFGSPIDLTPGNGYGLYSFARDSEGDLIGTTGQSLTQVKAGVVSPLGEFLSDFPLPTAIEFTGNGFEPFSGHGMIVVNGQFTPAQGLFAVMPVPEPGALEALGLGAVFLVRRRRR